MPAIASDTGCWMPDTLQAYGPGALALTGVIDNTAVLFTAQAAVEGIVARADAGGAGMPPKPKRWRAFS